MERKTEKERQEYHGKTLFRIASAFLIEVEDDTAICVCTYFSWVHTKFSMKIIVIIEHLKFT